MKSFICKNSIVNLDLVGIFVCIMLVIDDRTSNIFISDIFICLRKDVFQSSFLF